MGRAHGHSLTIEKPSLMSWRTMWSAVMRTMWAGRPVRSNRTGHLLRMGGSTSMLTGIAYSRGREAEGEQEQNFANQSALAVYA